MAAKTYFLKNTGVNGFGSLSESDPGASTMGTGWVVAKLGATNFSKLLYGTERASGTFGGTSTLATPAAPASGDAWRSENTVNGSFANANWTFTFNVRAVTAASAQRGRVKFRMWRSSNATGSGATEITAATQTCSIIPGISTSADNASSLTFNPGAFTLTDEYLFVQCEWEITTASGSNSGDIDFRASSSTVVTSDFAATQALTPSLLAADDSFAAPTITTGPVDVAPSLFTDSDSFPTPTVGATYALTPSLFDEGDSFFAPTVGATYDLTPSLFDEGDSFFAPTVEQEGGDTNLTPSLFDEGDSFFAPTVAPGAVDLTPSLFSDTDTFFAPTVAPGAVALTPALLTDSDDFFAPGVAAEGGDQPLTPSLFSDTDTFFAPTVAPGAVDIAPALLTDSDSFFAPTVAPGAVDIAPALLIDADTFFAPVVGGGAQADLVTEIAVSLATIAVAVGMTAPQTQTAMRADDVAVSLNRIQ